MKILHVDASARHDGSHSRGLSQHFVDALRARLPDLEVDRLDLAVDTPKPFRALETTAISMPPDQHTPGLAAAIAPSDALAARVLAADGLVIGTPIYNFGMPSTLKAFFDHVSRNGLIFLADETRTQGLLGDMDVAVLSSAGGACGPGQMFDGLDALTPHVRTIRGFIGVSDPDFVAARPMMFAGPDAAEASMAKAKRTAEEVAARWM